MKLTKGSLLIALVAGLLSVNSFASSSNDASEGTCQGFGPQTPRDIDSVSGNNNSIFSIAPSHTDMNLCNIHFHENAEHKAKDFSIIAGDGSSGYQCNISKTLSTSELKPTKEKICKSKKGDLVPGDTIEVHWVFSSCDVTPGKGLGSCVSKTCANPNLRVETQVFTLVNDSSALNWNDLVYDGNKVDNLHQPKAIPSNTGKPVEFTGSTTGPSYSESKCSPYQVSWSVRPKCAKLDINTIGDWCANGNVFKEDHAHGVRELVTHPDLLSDI